MHAVICRDGPSQLVNLPDDSVWQLDSSCINIPWALQQLALQTKADGIVPGQNCQGVFAALSRPAMPSGTVSLPNLRKFSICPGCGHAVLRLA